MAVDEDFNLNHKLVFFGTQEQSFITEEQGSG